MTDRKNVLYFEGSNFFRSRVVLSCLSGKPIIIENIRQTDEEPGIRDFEVCFIRLIDRISNGSKIVVNETGTQVKFNPGILYGGQFEHKCPSSRSIGYYLESIIILAAFCKHPVNVTFKGVTNNKIDPSIDMIRYSILSVFRKFLVRDEGLELKLEKRALPPATNGVVRFTCPLRRNFKAFQWTEMGKVQKVRGIVYTSRIAPNVGTRVMESAKAVFKSCLSDVYFTVDCSKGSAPGYGICLAALTNKGCSITAEEIHCKEGQNSDMNIPEDLGRMAAHSLLEEIYNGGCVDAISQPLVLTFMTLAPKDVSKVMLGPLTNYTIYYLKLLKLFFGVQFQITPHAENKIDDVLYKLGSHKILMTCVGSGYSNISKPQI